MIHTNSILKKIGKIDLCYMIRNFIYWCVKDDDNVNIQHIQYRKNLSSIENDKTNVLKISYREFPTSGKIFALIDFSFKETLHDINKLFTTDYIESMDVNVNETTYRYKFQSLLSLILEKMFILLHEDDPNIDIADEVDIINKFKATLQYTLQLYIAQPDKTIENISTEYSKLFQVNKETIQEFIIDVLYPGQREKQKRELENLVAILLENIRTFQKNHRKLFNTLYDNIKSIENVNYTIDNLLKNVSKKATLEEKKNYILKDVKISVEANINKYLNNNEGLNYLKNKKIILTNVIKEWEEIPSNSFQGMHPLTPTYI